MGFCGAWDPGSAEQDISKLLEFHKTVRATYEDPKYIKWNKNRRMLDMRDHTFRVSEEGLRFKSLKPGECDFIDKNDGHLYHLVVV